MNKQTISLGRIMGIPIRLDYSWFLVFGLLTWSLATGYYPDALPDAGAGVLWFLGAATAIMLFGSVLLHELGHSVVALRFKIPVNRITLFLFGGVAEIGAEPPSPSAEFLIAIAGPIVSFALAALFAVLQFAVTAWAPVYALAGYVALINGSLALFNLIPGFPLDGGRIFRSLIWGITHNLSRATLWAANVGRAIAFLMIAVGVWEIFSGDLGGLWFGFIGWYLQGAATAQLEQQQIQDLFAGHPVSEAMNRSYTLIPATATLEQTANQNLLAYWQRAFVVDGANTIVGLLTWRDIRAIPRDRWWGTTTAQAMVPLNRLSLVTPDTELRTAAAELARGGSRLLAVIWNGQVQGTLGREELYGFVQRVKLLRA